MKTLFASLAVVTFSFAPVFAGEVAFPKSGDAMFHITIPDNWVSDADNDDVVEATSPEENISLSIWEISSETEVDTVEQELQEILSDYANEVKLDEQTKRIEVAGIPGLFMTGSGKDTDDNHEIGFVAFILVKGEKAAIVFFEIDGNYSKSELKKFEEIIKSIDVPAAK